MKSARHSMILQLIESENIETQDELVSRLREHGFEITQATVSRDIKDLRLIKVLTDDGRYKYATVEHAENGLTDRFLRIFSHSVQSISAAGNIIVIKVIAGSANVAGEAIDSLRLPEIAGTIAGDNTIFCAVRDVEDVPDVMRRFQNMSSRK